MLVPAFRWDRGVFGCFHIGIVGVLSVFLAKHLPVNVCCANILDRPAVVILTQQTAQIKKPPIRLVVLFCGDSVAAFRRDRGLFGCFYIGVVGVLSVFLAKHLPVNVRCANILDRPAVVILTQLTGQIKKPPIGLVVLFCGDSVAAFRRDRGLFGCFYIGVVGVLSVFLAKHLPVNVRCANILDRPAVVILTQLTGQIKKPPIGRLFYLVEPGGIEPPTSCVQGRRSPS
jgi:hypothetical protein